MNGLNNAHKKLDNEFCLEVERKPDNEFCLEVERKPDNEFCLEVESLRAFSPGALPLDPSFGRVTLSTGPNVEGQRRREKLLNKRGAHKEGSRGNALGEKARRLSTSKQNSLRGVLPVVDRRVPAY
jgi:hypothetical protein